MTMPHLLLFIRRLVLVKLLECLLMPLNRICPGRTRTSPIGVSLFNWRVPRLFGPPLICFYKCKSLRRATSIARRLLLPVRPTMDRPPLPLEARRPCGARRIKSSTHRPLLANRWIFPTFCNNSKSSWTRMLTMLVSCSLNLSGVPCNVPSHGPRNCSKNMFAWPKHAVSRLSAMKSCVDWDVTEWEPCLLPKPGSCLSMPLPLARLSLLVSTHSVVPL
mmetsp:Transcript_12194/g.17870  ORF Transcript_12194/g.17870 Transcript_12194/m.17870 type:complete len:219 (+) Transcript_12194:536-1192(+)